MILLLAISAQSFEITSKQISDSITCPTTCGGSGVLSGQGGTGPAGNL